MSLNGKSGVLEAGTSVPGLGKGMHAIVDTSRAQNGVAQSFEFELGLNLTGLSRVQFLPTGRISSTASLILLAPSPPVRLKSN